MRRMMWILAALLLAMGPAWAWASANPEVTFYNAAKVSMPILDVPVGAKAVGMGEAYTAAGRDVFALHYNPAGLARMDGFELALMHNEWSSALGLRQEYLAYGQGVGSASGFALAVNYFSLGALQERSATGALGAESQATAMAASLGYGSSFMSGEKLKLGINAEYGNESLFKTSQTAFGAGLGLLYEFTRSLSMGISAKHLGAGAAGFSPPSTANFGLAADFGDRKFLTAIDMDVPFNGEPTLKAGLELNLGQLAVRGGWRQPFGAPEGDVQSGYTAGAGFRAGLFSVDYAFVPYGELSTTHRVSATLQLPGDFFKPQVLGAESSTTTAKRYYDKAVGLEKSGADVVEAMVAFQKAVEAYPEAMRPPKGKPQNFYLTAVKKVKELKAGMKKGDNEQVRKLVAQAISQGQENMRAKKYRDAVEKFQEALSMDKENKEAQKLLNEANALRGSRLTSLLSEARDAYRAGQMSTAIEKYRAVRDLSPGNKDVEAFFASKRAEIAEHLRRIHRRGIDLYVAGKVQEAINTWKGGSSLDPSDTFQINFKRDIDKAQKLLDLRGGK